MVASVASIPQRQEGLAAVVKSMMPQVAHLHVYLNGYPAVPSFLDHERITVVRSQDEGDRGVGGKFYAAEDIDGFHVVVDDDFLYPANYVGKLVDCVERHGRRVIACVHAARFRSATPSDYFDDRQLFVSHTALCPELPVHVVGTGTMAYHTSRLRIARGDVGLYGADLSVSVQAQRMGIPIMAVERPGRWLWMHPSYTIGSVFQRMRQDPAIRAELNRVMQAAAPWGLYVPG